MAVVTVSPRYVANNSGSWATPDNVLAEDGAFATVTANNNSKQLAVHTFHLGEAIKPASTITKVEFIYKAKVDGNTAASFLEVHGKTGGTGGTFLTGGWWSTAATTTLTEVVTDVTAGTSWDRDDLLDGGVVIYFRGRVNNTTDTVFSLDSIKLRVTYTEPTVNTLVYEDDCSDSTFSNVWGDWTGSMVSNARVTTTLSGGSTFTKLDGSAASGNRRTIAVNDGDDVDPGVDVDERTEIGYNSQNTATKTFARFYDGEYWKLAWAAKLPSASTLDENAASYQVTTQIKQLPGTATGGTPMQSVHLRGGNWELWASDYPSDPADSSRLWYCPATRNLSTRFILDIIFSDDPAIGKIRLTVIEDGGNTYTSPIFQKETLITETGVQSPIPYQNIGEAVPAHWRAGIYHLHTLAGGTLDMDNFQAMYMVDAFPTSTPATRIALLGVGW